MIQLVPVSSADTEKLWKMQVEAFRELYAKYQDTETSPAAEPYEKVLTRFAQPYTHYYFIRTEGTDVGAIRIVDYKVPGKSKRISPLFIMQPYRGRGYAQQAIRAAEALHGGGTWELDTILQEEGNCRLYEKMGYRQTGKTEAIQANMTLVFYRKEAAYAGETAEDPGQSASV